MFDVAIIGAGVVGAMVARELAKYQMKIVVLEKENSLEYQDVVKPSQE